jgi:hypothetical protein
LRDTGCPGILRLLCHDPIPTRTAASYLRRAAGGAGQSVPNTLVQTAYAFSTALPDRAYAATLINGASNIADALLGPRDKVFGTAILGTQGFGDSAESTFDFRFRGDLLLGLIDGQQTGFANSLGFESMEFTIIATGVEILDSTFRSLAVAESRETRLASQHVGDGFRVERAPALVEDAARGEFGGYGAQAQPAALWLLATKRLRQLDDVGAQLSVALAPLNLFSGRYPLAPARRRQLCDGGRLLKLRDGTKDLAHEGRSRGVLNEVRGCRRRD